MTVVLFTPPKDQPEKPKFVIDEFEKSFMVEGYIPGVITRSNRFLMYLNYTVGWIDHQMFKNLIAAAQGAIPLEVLHLRIYFEAHESGELKNYFSSGITVTGANTPTQVSIKPTTKS